MTETYHAAGAETAETLVHLFGDALKNCDKHVYPIVLRRQCSCCLYTVLFYIVLKVAAAPLTLMKKARHHRPHS